MALIRKTRAGLALTTMATLLIGAAPAAPAERVVRAGETFAGTIAGRTAVLRIDPGTMGMPVLNASFAAAAGMKKGMFAISIGIGPIKRSGPTAVTKLSLAGQAFKRRVVWFEDAVAGADATIGPAGLPEDVIRFVLRAPQPGERTTTLHLVGGGLFGGWGASLAQAPLGKDGVLVRFDPAHPTSYISAGAGAAIARSHGGTFLPGVGEATISLGVKRPVRRMQLATPFAVGPVALTTLAVRTGDYGNASGIAEADAVESDADEVVTVVGKPRKKGYRDRLTLGADALAGCSSIIFDKPRKVVRLSCR